MKISIVITYYNQPKVLEWVLGHIQTWYDDTLKAVEIIIVDDGSKNSPALPVVQYFKETKMGSSLLDMSVYKVTKDIPWNQCGARNLGAAVSKYEWLLMLDVDHIFGAVEMDNILVGTKQTRTKRWFTFNRESSATMQTFPPGKNIYLMTKKDYKRIGGYDEDLTGEYLQDRLFIHSAQKLLGMPVVHPDTFAFVKVDGCARGLHRKSERNRQLIADKIAGKVPMSTDRLRFPWMREI